MAQLSHSQREIDEDGKLSTPEVILGLPLETRESHLDTLRTLVNEIGASLMFQYTLMLLPGTALYTDEARNKYQYNVKYRMLPTAFGQYREEPCFEIEEVAPGHKDLSYKDYLEMREVFFYLHNVNSNAIYRTLVRYIRYLGGDVIDFMLYLMKRRQSMMADDFPNRVVNDYIRDTQEELFDSREALVEFFSDTKNYEELKAGKRGKNLAHTYRSYVLLHAKEWAVYVTNCFRDYIFKKYANQEEVTEVVEAIVTHILVQAECQYLYFSKRSSIPERESALKAELAYDIPSVFMSNISGDRRPILKKEKVVYRYYMREDAIKYIQSFPDDQRLIDLALIVLRMDQNYLLPVFRRDEGAQQDSLAGKALLNPDFSPLKHNP
ncbi:MAG: hypothetical protein HYT89_03780 [Candidatus Omnitrophica bacterium]|nr:hypothetical protein [Candidatus Omnitrophota bacterium]